MSASVNSQPKFYAPKLNPLLTRLCQSISYLGANVIYRMDLVVEPAQLEKVKALGEERIVYLPNHPTLDDGIALFMLSARLGQLFHYVVAYESFQGWLANFLPLVGAYSMRRGIGDRPSIAQTLEILRQPACRLVIFPEGGCSYQNDTVMPFRTGAIQLPLQAMSKLNKQGEIVPAIYLVPISLKYGYPNSMNAEINQTLRRLEQALNITKTYADFYQRLRLVGEQVLENIETECGLEPQTTTDKDWNERIKQLKEGLLHQCEEKLNLSANPLIPMRERVYKIQSVLESRLEEAEESQQEIWEFIDQTTFRLLNFDAIYDGYVAASPTPERFLDTLTRLEREVFRLNRPFPKGHRQAIIRLGEPVNLQTYFSSYQHNRLETVEQLTEKLRQMVQDNLNP
jgi:1-acyl-sn-glycerol-3-phosphate acyltransferase